MQLTQFTDYSLRVLIFIGLKQERATVAEIALAFKASRNHLVKVVHLLSSKNYLTSQKGKKGGIWLAKEPSKIRIGDFVSAIEPNLYWVECFGPHNTCPIAGCCQLETILRKARSDFIGTLNEFTLADLLVNSAQREERKRRLGIS